MLQSFFLGVVAPDSMNVLRNVSCGHDGPVEIVVCSNSDSSVSFGKAIDIVRTNGRVSAFIRITVPLIWARSDIKVSAENEAMIGRFVSGIRK
jgi:hypothetical protein